MAAYSVPWLGWSKRRGSIYCARIEWSGAFRVGFTTRHPEVRLNEERGMLGRLSLLAYLPDRPMTDETELHHELAPWRAREGGRSVYRACVEVFRAFENRAGLIVVQRPTFGVV